MVPCGGSVSSSGGGAGGRPLSFCSFSRSTESSFATSRRRRSFATALMPPVCTPSPACAAATSRSRDASSAARARGARDRLRPARRDDGFGAPVARGRASNLGRHPAGTGSGGRRRRESSASAALGSRPRCDLESPRRASRRCSFTKAPRRSRQIGGRSARWPTATRRSGDTALHRRLAYFERDASRCACAQHAIAASSSGRPSCSRSQAPSTGFDQLVVLLAAAPLAAPRQPRRQRADARARSARLHRSFWDARRITDDDIRGLVMTRCREPGVVGLIVNVKTRSAWSLYVLPQRHWYAVLRVEDRRFPEYGAFPGGWLELDSQRESRAGCRTTRTSVFSCRRRSATTRPRARRFAHLASDLVC